MKEKTARLNFLPEPRFEKLRPVLQHHLAAMWGNITPDNFPQLCDDLTLGVLHDAFHRIRADEGSIWLLDDDKTHLIIAHNNGPDTAKILGFRQPLKEGIVSMVAATEQAFAENEVYKNKRHSATLDRTLGKTTYAMVAVPFYLLGEVRGVVSCVQMLNVRYEEEKAVAEGTKPPGFSVEHMGIVSRATSVVSELIEARLIRIAIGWSHR